MQINANWWSFRIRALKSIPKIWEKQHLDSPKQCSSQATLGNVEPYRGHAIEAAQKYQNFYLETCSTYRTPGVIEELVAKAGAERVLFGSDVPLMDPRSQIGKIITADISDDAKRLVLGENAKRILKL